MNSLLNKVKLALRISHTYLDDEINDTIASARAEMVRAGVSSVIAEDETNQLVNEAIKTYCKFVYSNDNKMAEGFFNSWSYQLENLRKSEVV